jgi:hypothetical protein
MFGYGGWGEKGIGLYVHFELNSETAVYGR